VVSRWARSINRSFMEEQGREVSHQEQDCPTCRFWEKITNSPYTRKNRKSVHIEPEWLFTFSRNQCSRWAGICSISKERSVSKSSKQEIDRIHNLVPLNLKR